MGVLDSFKQDAFLSSQTVQVGNNQTPSQQAAEGHYPGKRAGRHLSGDQRQSCCPWEAIEEASDVPWGWWGCSVCWHHQWHLYFVLFQFYVQQIHPGWERKRLLTSYSRNVTCTSLLTGPGWWGAFPGWTDIVWTPWCCSDPEVSPILLCPAWPGWLQSKSLFIFAELVRWVPVKNKAHSPANLITPKKNLHSLDPEILTYSCKTQGKKQGIR